jgi:hypothetical protein
MISSEIHVQDNGIKLSSQNWKQRALNYGAAILAELRKGNRTLGCNLCGLLMMVISSDGLNGIEQSHYDFLSNFIEQGVEMKDHILQNCEI